MDELILVSLKELFDAVNRSADLSWPQWETIYDFTIQTKPRLIVELGRGYGNSTCLFTEASQQVDCKVVSIGDDAGRAFERKTWPSVQRLVEPSWHRSLTIVQEDITKLDFRLILGENQRTLLFWDAHGESLARFIIDRVFPLLMQREHQVVVHDIGKYNANAKYAVGDLASDYEELLPLMTYLTQKHVKYSLNPTGWLHFDLNYCH
jgi:hypothetical protein